MIINRVRAIAGYVFAIVGLTTVLLLNIGVVADVLAIDPTSGGYEAPYAEYNGEPIDWDETYLTDEGMYTPGYVLDTHVNCTDGMISVDLFGLSFNYRELSERALAIHAPREACEERGFSPEF